MVSRFPGLEAGVEEGDDSAEIAAETLRDNEWQCDLPHDTKNTSYYQVLCKGMEHEAEKFAGSD